MPCGPGLLAETVDNSFSIAGNGLLKTSLAISPITPCRQMAWRCPHFDTTSKFFGIGSYVGVAREQACCGCRWRN